jgi:hypothetical protein
MDQAERYRVALDGFSRELWTILADVPPEISETPIGRTMLATALIKEAVALVQEHDLDEPTIRAILDNLVNAALAR